MSPQLLNEYFQKQALIEAQKEQYFTQLADVTSMPKNMGKKIKRYHYIPLLDAANLNDQGIDAAGAVINAAHYEITYSKTVIPVANANKAAAVTAINDNTSGITAVAGADNSAGAGFANVTLSGGSTAAYTTAVKANAVAAVYPGAKPVQRSGKCGIHNTSPYFF